MRDINLTQLQLKENDTCRKNGKITTNFEPLDKKDVVNKAYLDTKLSKVEGQISYVEKEYFEFKLHNDKQPEEVLIERAVKTTIQIIYDKVLFDKYDNVDEVIEDYLLIDEVNEKPILDLEEVNDDNVFQWFYS